MKGQLRNSVLLCVIVGLSTSAAQCGIIHAEVSTFVQSLSQGIIQPQINHATGESTASLSVSGNGYGGGAYSDGFSEVELIGWQELGTNAFVNVISDVAQVQSKATWSDTMTVSTSNPDIGGFPPAYLTITYYVSGQVWTQLLGEEFSASEAGGEVTITGNGVEVSGRKLSKTGFTFDEEGVASKVDLFFSDGWAKNAIGQDIFFGIWGNALKLNLPLQPKVDESGAIIAGKYVTSYQILLHSWAAATGDARANSDFSHTAVFGRVELPDGRTPEEVGFELSFESGIQSPNLTFAVQAVPEPSSVALLCSAVLMFPMAFRRYRRRKVS